MLPFEIIEKAPEQRHILIQNSPSSTAEIRKTKCVVPRAINESLTGYVFLLCEGKTGKLKGQ